MIGNIRKSCTDPVAVPHPSSCRKIHLRSLRQDSGFYFPGNQIRSGSGMLSYPVSKHLGRRHRRFCRSETPYPKRQFTHEYSLFSRCVLKLWNAVILQSRGTKKDPMDSNSLHPWRMEKHPANQYISDDEVKEIWMGLETEPTLVTICTTTSYKP